MIDPGPYTRGKEYGRRLAEHSPNVNHEPAMREDLAVVGPNRAHRAFALGELRGYRHALGRPDPIVEGHRLEPDGYRYLGGGNYGSASR